MIDTNPIFNPPTYLSRMPEFACLTVQSKLQRYICIVPLTPAKVNSNTNNAFQNAHGPLPFPLENSDYPFRLGTQSRFCLSGHVLDPFLYRHVFLVCGQGSTGETQEIGWLRCCSLEDELNVRRGPCWGEFARRRRGNGYLLGGGNGGAG